MILRSCFLALALITTLSAAESFQPPDTKGVGIEQHLDAGVPINTQFRDETGARVPLRKFFDGKPVLLAPVYYKCPMLCSQILAGVVAALRPLSLKPGREFEIVALSFDPSDTPQDARAKRDQYAHSYSRTAGTAGWHFLTGDQSSIQAVMDAIGFHYRWDARNKMFVHASGIMLLTPEGRLSRYLYGVDYEPKDLKLGLVESSHNRIGSPADQILLLCYHYDPKTGKYGMTVLYLLRGAAVLMIVLLIVGLFLFWRRDLRTYGHVTKEIPHT